MAMIKFDHVDKYYGKFHALKISISNSRKEKLSLSLVLLVQERDDASLYQWIRDDFFRQATN